MADKKVVYEVKSAILYNSRHYTPGTKKKPTLLEGNKVLDELSKTKNPPIKEYKGKTPKND